MAEKDDPTNETPDAEEAGLEHPVLDVEAGGAAGPEAPATLEDQLAAERDRVLRLQAELQNTLSRKSRELADERRYAGLSLMRDILPVLDNVDRAIEAAEKAEEASGLLNGFKMVRQQMATVLSQHACEPIAAEGQPFNPDLHEAILQQPSADHEPGTVIMATQVGYKLHERVVRPSQVIVAGVPDEQ